MNFFLLLPVVLVLVACGQQIAANSVSDKVSINIPNVQQEQNTWCWNACSESILKYYGKDFSQCEIATWVLAQRGIQQNVCDDPSQGSFGNVMNLTPGSIQDILSSNGIDTTVIKGALAFNEIKNQIDQGKPFIIYLYNAENGNQHYVVCMGYDNSGEIYFMDPAYGAVRFILLSYLNTIWDSTLIVN